MERKICLGFNRLSKYKKLLVVYLIFDHRYRNESKWYQQGQFYFHWLDIRQVGEMLGKINNEIAKKNRIIPIDLKTILETYTSLIQTYPDNSN